MDKISATEFQLETGQLLDTIELLILALEKSPQDGPTLLAAIKGWHELKSLAALFELQPIAALAFQVEGILNLFLAGPRVADEEAITLLLGAIDQIQKYIVAGVEGQAEAESELVRFAEELARFFGWAGVAGAAAGGGAPPPHPLPPAQGDILIIEDELINRTLLEAMVHRESALLTITSVDSAEEGLYYYFSRRFDLVFLDIMMPNLDGYHFIDIVEKNRQAGHLRFVSNIVVQTAVQSLAQLTALAKRESVQEIIRKPISAYRVGECIRRYCQRR